jgi:prepilin-type N-terminal cleavage/methylation domain-containing protein
MKKTVSKQIGFTLIEMMMVLVIMSTIIIMIAQYTVIKTDEVRRENAAIQIQQILNASLSYYVNNGKWPASLAALTTALYLPPTLHSPYVNKLYTITSSTTTGVLTVSLTVEKKADANILAGMVPLGYTSGTGLLTVNAQVNIPGQNLNNARSVNYAGIFHPGACVPTPTCPGTGMTPEIFVATASVMGDNYSASIQVYPITNFTAYALGPPSSAPPLCPDQTTANNACYATQDHDYGTNTPLPTTALYWRVCMDVATSDGDVPTTNNGHAYASWAMYQTLIAFTRCAPSTEGATASDLTVWAP